MNPEPKINILMVDDEPANLVALEATLETLGQNLVKASSGKAALRHLLEEDFALILLDVQMPEMNGIETAVAIRERERSRHIPVIFLTAQLNTDDIMFKGYSTGAVDFLTKPLQPEILRAKTEVFVELALMRQRLQSEIAERTKIAAEISQLNDKLEAKNHELSETIEELERYSYSISHDMRAPLRSMFGFSQILMEECQEQLSEEHQSYLRKIISGAIRLDRLIQDVLSYSLISRSRFKLQPIDLQQLTRDVIEQYPGFQLPDADVQAEGDLPRVLANEAALTQCISNLVGNAIKFVEPGKVPRVRIQAEMQGNEVRLWFIDNGIGIAPADLDRIFGIFVKVHSAETYSGTGIGLSIVRKAAEKMGGSVGVESTVNEGSRFWLQLKLAP
jgi:two-component system, sensor histidine kinase and response regulator